jgi:hypothetical protein
MPSSGMVRFVALVKSDVSEEHSASNITMTRICELGTMLAITSNRRTLRSYSAPIATVGVPVEDGKKAEPE